MNTVTINALLEKLIVAKHMIGGDKLVSFWLCGDNKTYYLEPSAFPSSIEGKIAQNRSEVSFEISENIIP